jgi:hypothetical protein
MSNAQREVVVGVTMKKHIAAKCNGTKIFCMRTVCSCTVPVHCSQMQWHQNILHEECVHMYGAGALQPNAMAPKYFA